MHQILPGLERSSVNVVVKIMLAIRKKGVCRG